MRRWKTPGAMRSRLNWPSLRTSTHTSSERVPLSSRRKYCGVLSASAARARESPKKNTLHRQREIVYQHLGVNITPKLEHNKQAESVSFTNHDRRDQPRFGRQTTRRITSAEFFDPNATQLHTACSTCTFRPGWGT